MTRRRSKPLPLFVQLRPSGCGMFAVTGFDFDFHSPRPLREAARALEVRGRPRSSEVVFLTTDGRHSSSLRTTIEAVLATDN
jgi:hypothetical protein